ncbi:hypothetical protein FWJ25_14060 [Marinobacter salinexigens]|uniref:Uncharacterized protein n=1 Tax=Marinobacter salinexigens TaxID=2919747 RepID=A0A5B0VD01_9GAMM|nr:hypothetical protein [Marinobacter salinexigens]KAA1172314.1 hypothetical protein FWJ25_14060 [Marinobacter salinexigens]
MKPDSFSLLRSVLAYAGLLVGVSVFLPGHTYLAVLLMISAIVLGWGNLRMVGRVIVLLIVVLAGVALALEPKAVEQAASNMTRIGSLIITVMLLSAVLSQSDDLKVISRSLFGGRAVFRYFGMTSGTALLSVPLNFGAVGVIATMIGLQVKEQGDSASARNAARAVVRGFGASPMASPLSIAIVMTVTLVPGLSSWKLIALGLPFAILYLLGGLLAREDEPVRELADATNESALFPWLRFIGIIGSICVGAFLLNSQGSLPYSQSVTFSCLAAVAIGLLYRRVKDGRVALPSLSMINNELAIMGGSAFLGGIIGTFALGWLGMDFSLPSWAYPMVAMAVPWLFFIGGSVGVNPIISGTLSGSILGPIWPSYGLLGLGLGIIVGWGVTIAGTPYSANSLLLERCTGYKAHTASYEWSLKFSMVALGAASVVCAVFTLPF